MLVLDRNSLPMEFILHSISFIVVFIASIDLVTVFSMYSYCNYAISDTFELKDRFVSLVERVLMVLFCSSVFY